ncbi:MAG: nucleotidyltransferase domain-containing protein [Pirellulales bacterium]|nr:nucleotidyltransferase domain-containing protein [Pirellulales bacterium]
MADRIQAAFLFGSVAVGRENRAGDIDLMVVGGVTFAEVVEAIAPIQRELGREINPVVFPPDEFRRKLDAGHHFLSNVIRTDKLFLIGDERELARLAAKRMAD